tara:strand:- start:24 stop:1025 length:1002 start_codon:yes stop_codon:yes gene_type:complete
MSNKVWNGEFINALEEIETICKNKGDVFRARAYKKAADSILLVQENIYSVDQIKDLPGVGKTILIKLQSLVDTGKIDLIEKEKNNIIHQLCKIYGVGPKKAVELAKSVGSIEELKKKPELLNDVQKIGLEYFEEIQQRIPRNEIDEYNKIIKASLNSSNTNNVSIVGSYRRGAQSSGDIDVIFSSNDPSDFDKFLDNLIQYNIIVKILSRGKVKCLTIGRLTPDHTPRRIDFLYTPPKEYPFAILYFTGSKAFNVIMRQHSLIKGHSLNEHGFTPPSKVDINSEEDIFNYLGLVYKNPTERKSGLDVQLVKSQSTITTKQKESKKIVKSSTRL